MGSEDKKKEKKNHKKSKTSVKLTVIHNNDIKKAKKPVDDYKGKKIKRVKSTSKNNTDTTKQRLINNDDDDDDDDENDNIQHQKEQPPTKKTKKIAVTAMKQQQQQPKVIKKKKSDTTVNNKGKTSNTKKRTANIALNDKSSKSGTKVKAASDGGTDLDLDIDPNLLFIPNDNLSKSMDPYDRFNNNSSEKLLDIDTISQKSKSTHIIKDRSKQTIMNLSHDKSHPYYNQDLATSKTRLTQILPSAIYPMQRFLENGFTPVDNMNPLATIACITRTLNEECDFIASQKIDESRKKAKRNDGSARKVAGGEEDDHRDNDDKNDDDDDDINEGSKKIDLANTKLTQLWGEDQYHSFGYHRRRPKELQAKMDKAYMSEKLDIFKACYEYDCIEPDVHFGATPGDMRMFTEIYDKYYPLYKADDQIIYDSTAMTPKIDIEVLERNYLRKYRMKPEPGEKVELCSQGPKCVFMTLIKANHQGYVARVFYTKKEIKTGVIYNKDRLCIDCLLKVWTRTHDLNIFHEISVDKAMNHFSVRCEPGEYSPHCMLTVAENGRRTGIEKHVPRFSENMRHPVTMVKNYDEGRQLHATYTPYLAEIGMDF